MSQNDSFQQNHSRIKKVLNDFPNSEALTLPEVKANLKKVLQKKYSPKNPNDYEITKSFIFGINNSKKLTKLPKSTPINKLTKFPNNYTPDFSFGAFSYSTRTDNYDVRVDTSGRWNTISTATGGGFRNSQNAFVYFDHSTNTWKLRRPTPRELEYSMMWPLDWTRYGVDESGHKYELTEAQRAFLCGNGIVADIPRLIVEKYILPKLTLPLKTPLRLLSMFSGANGSCMNLSKKYFKTVAFYEFDKVPSDILRFHYPEIENKGDVTKEPISKMPSCDFLITSPPCQSYSSAGSQRGEDDDRGKLVFHSMDYIIHHKPRFVIFENVKNFATFDNGKVLDRFLQGVTDAGYKIHINIINSNHHGSIQKRERTFIFLERAD